MSLDALSEDGRFAVLAIDHRDSMRRFLRPDAPDSLSAQEITDLKSDIVRQVAPHGATGLMLESEYSIPQLLDNGSVPDGMGFLAALESQGYFGTLGTEPTTLLANWSPAQAAAAGAAGCKLLLPYHPDRPLAADQEQVAALALKLCAAANMPLILEPLFYDLDDPVDRPDIVQRTAVRFAAMQPQLLKLPFPVDPHVESDRSVWADACAAITDVSPMPWALLSGGGDFDVFQEQVTVAVEFGAAGCMAGRALWGEAAQATGAQRREIIESVVIPRMGLLRVAVGL